MHARSLILGEFRQAQSFEDVYRAIGATYLVDHTGKNALIQGEGLFDVIVSFHVLEHVRRENVAEHLAGCARLLKPGSALTADAILAHCAEHLPPFKTPKRVALVASLPKTERGKLDRKAVAAQWRAP